MYDVIVIGGGPGGYAAAIRASQLGGQAALIEAAEIGGVCVNRGCLPSKVWARAAFYKQSLEVMGEFGVKAEYQGLDPARIKARKEGVSGDVRMGMGGLLSQNKIEVIEGRARLENPQTVVVNGKSLETRQIILATGAAFAPPEAPGVEAALLPAEQLYELTELPGAVLVYGGGHIEVETAAILNALGVKVTLAFDSPRILPDEDGDLGQRLSQALRAQGVTLVPRATLAGVAPASAGFEAKLSGSQEQTVVVDRIITAGRRPNSADLGLESAGVSLGEDGEIAVDRHQRTNVPNIYAIGDVTGGWMLSFEATAMGITAAENAMGRDSVFRSRLVPRGIFTLPEAASVGLSEEAAEDEGYDVETGDFPMSINGLALCYGELDGAAKVVVDSKYGEVLGVHLVGGRATELIWGAAQALALEATAEDLARSLAVHPTFSEALVMAAQDALGWALYLPRR